MVKRADRRGDQPRRLPVARVVPARGVAGRRPGRAPRAGRAGRLWSLLWTPTTAYVLAAAAVLGGLLLWDHIYEARQAAAFRPPPPQVLVKNLVEDVVGTGTVRNVTLDEKSGALTVTVEDVLVKPRQSPAEVRRELTTEGTLPIQLVQSRMPWIKTITLRLVKGGRLLATARLVAGQKAPVVDISPDLR